MGEWCVNELHIKVHSVKAERQLADFKEKSKTEKEILDISATYPCPMEEREYIEHSSSMKAGFAILRYRSGESSDIEKYLDYSWVKNEGITNLSELEMFLIKEKVADLELGQIALDNHSKYGTTDVYSWCIKNWSTTWSAYSELLTTSSRQYSVKFITKNCPPEAWLKKISADYPDLLFTLDWEVWFDTGTIIAINGTIIEYETFPEDENAFEDDLEEV